jgi:hypothetical protein
MLRRLSARQKRGDGSARTPDKSQSPQEVILKSYVAVLNGIIKEQQAEEQARRHRAKEEAAASARERLVPLQERLKRLLDSIPPAIQAEGLSIAALQSQLRARGRGHSVCHIGELGAALRRLGWRRVRRWDSSADGFRALWFPLSVNQVEEAKLKRS